MNIESDHFKSLEELIDTIKMWVKNEEEYYDRWFGLNEMNILVKEIERLKEEIKGYEQERERVLNIIEERNNKAIEYIENDLSHMTSNGKLCRKHLLDILKGDDKE